MDLSRMNCLIFKDYLFLLKKTLLTIYFNNSSGLAQKGEKRAPPRTIVTQGRASGGPKGGSGKRKKGVLARPPRRYGGWVTGGKQKGGAGAPKTRGPKGGGGAVSQRGLPRPGEEAPPRGEGKGGGGDGGPKKGWGG